MGRGKGEVCAHVCVQVCIKMHVEAEISIWYLPLFLATLFSETGSFTRPGVLESFRETGRPASCLAPPAPHSSVGADYTSQGFSVGARNLSASPHAYTPRTSHWSISPVPCLYLFLQRLHSAPLYITERDGRRQTWKQRGKCCSHHALCILFLYVHGKLL